MHDNPAEDWQRLTEVYRQMGDEELEEVAADFADLTPTAQEALRSEMKSRGLRDPSADPRTEPRAKPAAPEPAEPSRWASSVAPDDGDSSPEGEDGAEGNEEDGRPREYTWKTPLCECEDRDHAWQVSEALRRAGIESWIERPGRGWVIGGPRVVVAADQLEQAREVAERPIPQDIVDLSKMEVPEFVPPKCPACGAGDPVLESAEPSNAWLCEACGKQWTEPAAEEDGEPNEAGR
ncbi:MAG TPA: hypothetical protein VN776_07495 [Terracidiphilus sp.]|nr:hypothetical protein [Terracidiphilus sp.]